MFQVENASEFTDTQSLFLHWAELYDWVFSLPHSEKPSDRIIYNDEAFDAWYKSYIAKRMHESRAEGSSSGRRKTAASHKNVIQF